MHPNKLERLCNPCLHAFGLTLDRGGEHAPLQILKYGETSVVIKARCFRGGVSCNLVLKGTPAPAHRHPSAMYAVEAMLSAAADDLVIPARLQVLPDGDFYFASSNFRADDTIWSVTTYEDNLPALDWLSQSANPWNLLQTRSAGALLARTHAASQAIKPGLLDLGREIESSIVSSVPKLLLDAFASVDADFLASISLDNLSYHRLVAIVSKAAVTLENSVHAKSLLAEEILVHGDYQPGNVLYRGEKAFGLIDWDYARIDNPLMDVAYGLIMYAGNLTSAEIAPFDINLSRQFLQGYADQIAMKGREPVCMPDCFFTPDARDNHVFSSYMKLSAALILLWSLSEFGRQHPCGAVVARQAIRLMQRL